MADKKVDKKKEESVIVESVEIAAEQQLQALLELEEQVQSMKAELDAAEKKRLEKEKELKQLDGEFALLQKEYAGLASSSGKRKKELEEAHTARSKELESMIQLRQTELDSLIAERKKAIESINSEGSKIVASIRSAINDVLEAAMKSGKGVGEVYVTAANLAKERLDSALTETDKVIASLVELNDEIFQTSSNYAETAVIRRREAEIELQRWREQRLAEIDVEIKAASDKNFADMAKLRQLKSGLDARESSLRAEKEALESRIDEEVETRVGSIESENEALKAQLKELIAEREELNKEKTKYLRLYRTSGASDKKALEDEIRALREEVASLRKKAIPVELQSDIVAKAKQFEPLTSALTDARADAHELEAEVARLRSLEGLNSSLREIADGQNDKIDELKEYIKKLKGDDYSREFRISPIKKPIFAGSYSTLKLGDISEIEWLEKIKTGIRNEGFDFSDRIINAFHTCVKTAIWSPVTVLAGVSGTGKSELPRLYSQYGGLLFTNTPVKPDWDSPSSMLGYYNALERKFEARPILRAMYQMQQDGEFDKRLAMFLLDEMNLAHVELYFSDMLSKLEENRNKRGEQVSQIDIDLGAGIDALQIRLKRNMFWVGTMNEDETTKGLSDKVVDRSNVIVFPRPKMLVSRGRKPVSDNTELLDREVWNRWQNAYLDFGNSDAFHRATSGYKEIIERISERLEKGGRALGHRVWQSIEHYIAANPLVAAGVDSDCSNVDSDDNKRNLDMAFAEAVAFKVMPKLRGVETEGKVRRECLDGIKAIIDESVQDLSVDFNNALNAPYGVFMWKSGEFLEDKAKKNTESEE